MLAHLKNINDWLTDSQLENKRCITCITCIKNINDWLTDSQLEIKRCITCITCIKKYQWLTHWLTTWNQEMHYLHYLHKKISMTDSLTHNLKSRDASASKNVYCRDMITRLFLRQLEKVHIFGLPATMTYSYHFCLWW